MPKRKPKDPERSADRPHDWILRQIQRMEKFSIHDRIPIEGWEYRRAVLEAPETYRMVDQDYTPIRVGQMWGGEDITAFFRTTFIVPESHCSEDAAFDICLDGGEALLTVNGKAVGGLDHNRWMIPLGEGHSAGDTLDLEIEAFIINYPYDDRRNDERPLHTFERADVVLRDPVIERFIYDARFILDAYRDYLDMDDDYEVEELLLSHLQRACRFIPPLLADRQTARTAAKEASEYLKQKIYDSGLFRKPGRITLCAHSHLDIVYLWPIKETLRKNARTVANMLSLIEEYPSYLFSYSQPFLYQRLKELYPEIYQRVKQKILAGRWEPIGAMYVEPDGNLLGAESIVRQILFGKRFLSQEFGIDARTCWLPDVFGVMYTLPGILKRSGIDYFLTNKLSIWNDVNDFPYDTFRWRGPDGSEVLTHFPSTHFGQPLVPGNLKRHWNDYRQKEEAPETLFIYGWADGGGGPTRQMVEYAQRSDRFPGLPEVKNGSVEGFFDRIAVNSAAYPVWDDELYLEAHRGTYTTKGSFKRLNRKSELLYRDAEILGSFVKLFTGDSLQERLNSGWAILLLNQFHDTLPGTHSPAGVPDIEQDFQKVQRIGSEVLEQYLQTLESCVDTREADLMILNTLSWCRGAVIELTGLDASARSLCLGKDGQLLALQRVGESWFCQIPDTPAIGWVCARLTDSQAEEREPVATFSSNVIETAVYRIELGDCGQMTRLYDKLSSREVLKGEGNRFHVYEDNPGRKFSAWDIAYHLEELEYEVQQKRPWSCVANGPVLAIFESEFTVLGSSIVQRMTLYADSRRIDFSTEADWQDKQKMLKVGFELDVRTRSASFDLPFGHIDRATHTNTSWEQAKFEVCGHKWADLSQGDYGVALLNDCKYGYDVKDSTIRLSLIRSPIRPDGESDMGYHRFSYALFAHEGSWREACVDRVGYEFNIPLRLRKVQRRATGSLPSKLSLFSCDSDSVILETIKPAEDADGLIMRWYDSHGSNKEIRFSALESIERVLSCDLLENVLQEKSSPVIESPSCFTHRVEPYGIATYRINQATQTLK